MYLTTSTFVVGFLLTEVSKTMGQMCTDLHSIYTLKKGVRLSKVQIYSVKSDELVTCAQHCLLKTGCESINYNIATGLCELNRHSFMSTAPTNIQTAPSSFVQSDIQTWPTSMAGSCANHTCNVNSRCVASSDPVCEVSGCLTSDIPDIPYTTLNTTVSYFESPVGTVLKYTCDKDFFLPETRAECGAMGNWTFANCRLAEPSSCVAVKQCNPDSGDGEYWMRLPNFDFNRTRIYCHDMGSQSPREYLTLKFQNHGSFPSRTNLFCSGEGGVHPNCLARVGEVWYHKIRVDLLTMEIVRDDTTFARVSGNPPKYGDAFDCYTEHQSGVARHCGLKGEFTINLRETGWIVSPDQQWRETGWMPAMDAPDRSDDGAVIRLRCGGYLGGCSTDGSLLLVPNMADIIGETTAERVHCE
ncbi:uncharacterized protein [Haliotis cracherodii]|uniref:uncharacterized protein n=1 Tax=Haliotis cracherodii TaxID=6455 RepID=UPI0039EAC841